MHCLFLSFLFMVLAHRVKLLWIFHRDFAAFGKNAFLFSLHVAKDFFFHFKLHKIMWISHENISRVECCIRYVNGLSIKTRASADGRRGEGSREWWNFGCGAAAEQNKMQTKRFIKFTIARLSIYVVHNFFMFFFCFFFLSQEKFKSNSRKTTKKQKLSTYTTWWIDCKNKWQRQQQEKVQHQEISISLYVCESFM